MKILHISYSDNNTEGGVFFYVKDLTRIQKIYGIDCQWLTVKNGNLVLSKKELLKKTIKINPSIIHIHGVWTVCTSMIFELKKITKNIIVSPHGMLNRESLKKTYLRKKISLQYFKKKIYFYLFERRFLNQIKYFHALTSTELKEIRLLFRDKPIKILSTGFKINPKKNLKVKKELRNIFDDKKKILLFMSRLDEQKGLLELINCWKQLNKELEKNCWWLLIAGFGPLSEAVIDASKIANSRIIFHGPIFGVEKDFILQNSKGFILPSFNEGLPISLLEALSFNNTCLITKNCNMNKLLEEKIAFEINQNKNELNIKGALRKLFTLSEEDFQKRGDLGKEYINKNHNWDKIICEYISFYKSLEK